MDLIASRYFTRPSYLRIAERPVIIPYASRTAVGRFGEAMTRFRSRMSQRGISPLVIGDEIFWDVATEDGAGHSVEPQRGRIALFDALTAYNLYDPSKAEHSGYGAESGFLTDSVALYERYRDGAHGVETVPYLLHPFGDAKLLLDRDGRIKVLLERIGKYYADHPEIVSEWNSYYEQLKEEKAQFGYEKTTIADVWNELEKRYSGGKIKRRFFKSFYMTNPLVFSLLKKLLYWGAVRLDKPIKKPRT